MPAAAMPALNHSASAGFETARPPVGVIRVHGHESDFDDSVQDFKT
jgi:hypothetical protein